jgi:hypothetical protein
MVNHSLRQDHNMIANDCVAADDSSGHHQNIASNLRAR